MNYTQDAYRNCTIISLNSVLLMKILNLSFYMDCTVLLFVILISLSKPNLALYTYCNK